MSKQLADIEEFHMKIYYRKLLIKIYTARLNFMDFKQAKLDQGGSYTDNAKMLLLTMMLKRK